MEDINGNVTFCDVELQGSSNEDAAAAYRKLLDRVVCPQEVCQDTLKRCMEQQAAGKKAVSPLRWRHAAMAACGLIVLCVLGIIFWGEQISYALGRDHRQGYNYQKKEYGGVKFTRTFVVFSEWNQEIALGMQPQEGLYEGCYEDLQQLDLLRVLLPYYRVEDYEQEQKEIHSEPYYKGWYCTYRDGDSRISMNICYAPRTSARSVVEMPDSHEMIRVNDIEYDIQYYSCKADYEEYVKMQEYNRKGDADEQLLSREEYEEDIFYPVQIECMVNRIYYCFRLTEDIDVQEFLESIHIPPPDSESQFTAGYAGSVPYTAGGKTNTAAGRNAYKYTEVEYEGLELTRWYMNRSYAEQQITIPARQPEDLYVSVYEELKNMDLPEVLLPHYQVERYILSGSSDQAIQYEKAWYGIFEDGDSRISVALKQLGQVGMTAGTDMLSGHESRNVNGVEYEILYHARPITYEEYLLMQQQRVKYSYEAWSCSLVEYEESYFYYPVEIMCVVNGIGYSFKISEDIDLEEFLESIY